MMTQLGFQESDERECWSLELEAPGTSDLSSSPDIEFRENSLTYEQFCECYADSCLGSPNLKGVMSANSSRDVFWHEE
jgi:hypothetical protein